MTSRVNSKLTSGSLIFGLLSSTPVGGLRYRIFLYLSVGAPLPDQSYQTFDYNVPRWFYHEHYLPWRFNIPTPSLWISKVNTFLMQEPLEIMRFLIHTWQWRGKNLDHSRVCFCIRGRQHHDSMERNKLAYTEKVEKWEQSWLFFNKGEVDYAIGILSFCTI